MRALLIVLESLGVGSASHRPLASRSLDRLLREVPGLKIPTLLGLGLGEILDGNVHVPSSRSFGASYGRMIQCSAGVDGLSSLWEMAGVILGCPFAAFERLPQEFLAALTRECGIEFLHNPLGQPPLSAEIQKQHERTGRPILTFGTGGVLRVAAHQAVIPLDRLIHICRAVRKQSDAWRIPHVFAEPFQSDWEPSMHTLRLSLVPPRTILNALSEKGIPVETIGEIDEIFARSGVTRAHTAPTRAEILRSIDGIWRSPQNGFIFARLEHPGNSIRCARALEEFDRWLAAFLDQVESDDLLLIVGSNNGEERQELPILLRYDGLTGPLGVRNTLADVAATLGSYFGVSEHGRPWHLGEPLASFGRRRVYNGP